MSTEVALPPEAVGNDAMQDVQATTADAQSDVLPPDASETLFIHNLNEKVKLDALKRSLTALFKTYGRVLGVTAHKNLRMRGQAFVSLESKELAARAVKEVKGFPLYGKPMAVQFAKTRSDCVVKELDDDNMPAHYDARMERKRKARRHNPLAVKARQQRAAAKAGASGAAAPRPRTHVQMPDEYLPPNRVLFLQNLPVTTTKEALTDLFSQYANLVDIRTIATKKDIAFVEYQDEDSATIAKDALHNHKIDGEQKIKITYARK